MTKETQKDLLGQELDDAVAEALGWKRYPEDSVEQGDTWHTDPTRAPFGGLFNRADWQPSIRWDQGGPLITQFSISVVENLPCSPERQWEARPSRTAKGAGWWHYGYGPTPLIAAMRCIARNQYSK